MPTAEWKTVVAPNDLYKFMDQQVVDAANKVDSDGNSRVDGIVDAVVQEFRGAIRSSGRVALSQKPKAVPPECLKHVLILCVEALVSTTPALSDYAKSESLGWMIKASRDFLKELREGKTVSEPSDPDPLFVTQTAWGDIRGEATAATVALDLTTDGPV